MSIDALDWAFEQECSTPTQKLVLLALADHHNRKTGRCFPSVARLCDRTQLSKATVFRTLDALRRKGLIDYEKLKGKSNHYTLAFEKSHGETSNDEEKSHLSVEKSHGESEKSHGETKKSHSETLIGSNQKEPSNKERARAHRLPEGWHPDEALLEWARANVPDLEIEYEQEKFTDYWIGCGKTKVDWPATWRNWMRRAAREFSPTRRAYDKTTATLSENDRRIEAALSRRHQGNDGPRAGGPQLRLVKKP